MRARVIGIGLLAFVTGLHSQPLDLSGRIVRGNGGPVPDALVELKARGIAARTAADGSFVLSGNASIGPHGGRPPAYSLNPHFLVVDVRLSQEVKVAVFDGNGGLLGSIARRLERGRHSIALAEAMPDPGRNAGLYLLRLHLDGDVFIHPFFHSGGRSRGPVFAPAYRGYAAAKRGAVVDTLRIRKAGFQDLAVPVASYTAGPLGDLVLSESADDGRICARQRMQTTSDGVEVVFCEALFDLPPRVRLPTTAASSAYATMTREAFVTVAGASYPSTAPNSASPEMRRHASALYEIKIQNGKLESYRPAILFAESLFMAPLMGKAFEGHISKRTAANRYELLPTLPVRVQILAEKFEGKPGDASEFQVKAVIANLAMSVKAADGSCMPSLSSEGAQAPFNAGTDVVLPVGRVPSMHTFGNDELVFAINAGGASLGSLMSPTWFFTPLDIVKNALTPSGTYTGQGHGAPGSIPILSLIPVSGGGEACPQR
jgi:hypothetical protein